MISKIEKILAGLKTVSKDRKFISNVSSGGRSLASFQLNLAIKNYCSNFKTILDVGANKGQFAFAASQIFPEADIYSFEPVPDVYQTLKRNTKKMTKIQTFNKALGAEIGKIKFYKNKYSHASSALPIHDNQKKLIPGTSDVEEIEVEVSTLNDFLAGIDVVSPSLLKLDVQGYEKEVIKGASNVFDKIYYILFETSFIEMYQGEPLFDEMHEFVKEKGFKILAPVGFLQTDNLQIPQMDILYKRDNV